jgi:hydroxylamine reductase
MFCRQCEQTAGGSACIANGVCGKTNEAAAHHDVLVETLKGIGVYGKRARELGVTDTALDEFVIQALFSVVTNVNFDKARLLPLIHTAATYKSKFLAAWQKKHGTPFSGTLPGAASWSPAANSKELLDQASTTGIHANKHADPDIKSLKELLMYGIEGMAAYADHARILGHTDNEVMAFFYTALDAIADDTKSAEELTMLVMELGNVNFKCMEILDKAHTTAFGIPVPTAVSLGVKKGPAILVSGHDLRDLQMLLEQTEGKGISIYTHGEMLPAHAYPALKKYKHLAGNYGSAWQNQLKEFAAFPGAILMTTNCIQRPSEKYMANIFTTGLVAWPGVTHIAQNANGSKDFSGLIEKAMALKGFPEDKTDKTITVGFMHDTVLSVADKVIGAAKSGKLRHIFLVGGCDGAKPGRNYYSDLAAQIPKDCMVLTLACGKYRFNTQDFGTIEGLPRLLDMGQCNDAYSAIVVAVALSKALGVGVNDLPLSIILSWYEQKAVVILLTLLALGVKNIRIGPSLPAFVSPNILNFLVQKFNLAPITTPEQDLKAILG